MKLRLGKQTPVSAGECMGRTTHKSTCPGRKRLRVLTLLEFVVQCRLTERQEKLARLYAGNPKRTTARPRAEILLEAFKSIYLTTVTIGEKIHLHVTPLLDLQ